MFVDSLCASSQGEWVFRVIVSNSGYSNQELNTVKANPSKFGTPSLVAEKRASRSLFNALLYAAFWNRLGERWMK
jgi:hypothetical protein